MNRFALAVGVIPLLVFPAQAGDYEIVSSGCDGCLYGHGLFHWCCQKKRAATFGDDWYGYRSALDAYYRFRSEIDARYGPWPEPNGPHRPPLVAPGLPMPVMRPALPNGPPPVGLDSVKDSSNRPAAALEGKPAPGSRIETLAAELGKLSPADRARLAALLSGIGGTEKRAGNQ
jgi:hypothetical protein